MVAQAYETTLPPNGANALIDVVDAFADVTDGAERWRVATRIARSIGGKSLVIGAFSGDELLPVWSRANVCEDWNGYYWDNNLHHADLVLLKRQRGEMPSSYRAGTATSERGYTAKNIAWSHGLLDAGYGGHILRAYADPAGLSQKVVAIMTEADNGEDPFHQNDALVSGIMALLSANIGPPTPEDDAGKIVLGYTELSSREREVTSLLAEGMNTSRIAERLGLADVTVHKHFRNARIKMGASTREQTLALAMLRGEIQL